MTDEQINIAVAEACGNDFSICPIHLSRSCCGRRGWKDYCHDLNAMHEAECQITVGQMGRYLSSLSNIVAPEATYHPLDHQWWTVTATASQRAEAFLRTLGKWKKAVNPTEITPHHSDDTSHSAKCSADKEPPSP